MADIQSLKRSIAEVLREHDFTVEDELILSQVRFDLAAENDTTLIFVALRSDNRAWIDDFNAHQAALAATVSGLNLGPKWRDIYLLELTTDSIDHDDELAIAEEIQADTSVARKLVLDLSTIDGEAEIQQLFTPLIGKLPLVQTFSDVDVLASLKTRLIGDGFSSQIVAGLVDNFGSDDHDCVELLLANQQ